MIGNLLRSVHRACLPRWTSSTKDGVETAYSVSSCASGLRYRTEFLTRSIIQQLTVFRFVTCSSLSRMQTEKQRHLQTKFEELCGGSPVTRNAHLARNKFTIGLHELVDCTDRGLGRSKTEFVQETGIRPPWQALYRWLFSPIPRLRLLR